MYNEYLNWLSRNPSRRLWLTLTLAMIAVSSLATADTAILNGFKIENPLVPLNEILVGGPPRDGIPALNTPKFASAAEVRTLRPDEPVLGLEIGGEARAYPISILNWHEIVNDIVGATSVTISYCPLCGSGTAFVNSFQGKPGSFGVSGLLYNSDLVMYDRQTESLWSQIRGQAISGARKGERLTLLPVLHTTWKKWQAQHPKTRVLSRETGFSRDYARSPYSGYDQSKRLIFPIAFRSKAFHPKERVLGLELAGVFKAYPFIELAKAQSPLRDRIGDTEIVLNFDSESRSGTIKTQTGKSLPVINAFWFAWYAFHPDTLIFRAD